VQKPYAPHASANCLLADLQWYSNWHCLSFDAVDVHSTHQTLPEHFLHDFSPSILISVVATHSAFINCCHNIDRSIISPLSPTVSANMQYKDSICIFDGKNWLLWEQDIMSYTLFNKFADMFDKSLAPVAFANPNKLTEAKCTDHKAWRQMDQQPQGLVCSTVTGDICNKLLTEYPIYKSSAITTVTTAGSSTPVQAISSVLYCATATAIGTGVTGSAIALTAASMFAYLAAMYSSCSINQIFAKFGKMACVSILENTNPTLALDKIAGHYQQLLVNGLPLPDTMQALSMIHVLPPSFDGLATYLVNKKLVSNINTLDVHNVITFTFKACNTACNCVSGLCGSNTAAKVSGLHCVPGKSLSFHSQQNGPSGSGNHNTNRRNSGCNSLCGCGGGHGGHGGQGNKCSCSNGCSNKQDCSCSQSKGKGKARSSTHAAIEDSNKEYTAHIKEVTPNLPPTTCTSNAPPPVACYIGANIANLQPDSAELGFCYGLAPGSLEHHALDRLLHGGHVNCFEQLKANNDSTCNAHNHRLRMHSLPTLRTPHKQTSLLARLDSNSSILLAEHITPAATSSLPPTQCHKHICKHSCKGKLDLNDNADTGSTLAPEASGPATPTHCVAGVRQDNTLHHLHSHLPMPKRVRTLLPANSSTPCYSLPPPVQSKHCPA
jgi:hypothetical protein